MIRYWSFLMLHFLGMAMAFAFLLQLKMHGGAMFAIQWWPVLITGILLGAAFCLEPGSHRQASPRQKHIVPECLLPGEFSLKLSALVSFGLSPIWGWRNSAASLSYGLMDYFTLLLVVASLAMLYLMVAFALQMHEVAGDIGASPKMIRLLSFTPRCWLYFIIVPSIATLLGAGRMWRAIFSQPQFDLHQVIQFVQFQWQLVFQCWIGSVLSWLGLGLLAWQTSIAFKLLMICNKFLKERELNGLVRPAGREDGDGRPITDDLENETEDNEC